MKKPITFITALLCIAGVAPTAKAESLLWFAAENFSFKTEADVLGTRVLWIAKNPQHLLSRTKYFSPDGILQKVVTTHSAKKNVSTFTWTRSKEPTLGEIYNLSDQFMNVNLPNVVFDREWKQ